MNSRQAHTIQHIRSIYHGAASRWRNMYFRALGVHLGGYVWMRDVEIPRNWADITLEAGVSLDRGVTLLCSGPITGGKLVIRARTYVNRFTIFDAHERIEVGRRCLIGPHCYFTDGNHGLSAAEDIAEQPMVTGPVVIEDGVWIGAGVTVLSGIRIGRRAVVGAGSVVTSDVLPNTVVAGVPAHMINSRGSPQ